MSLGVTANQRKNGALLAYIANRVPGINLRKLLKIVYLIDERFIRLRGFPLTWFEYQVWERGPVAPEVYDVSKHNEFFRDFIKAYRNSDNKVIVEPAIPVSKDPESPFGELSEYDLHVIDEELGKYADKSADWLTDQTHLPDALWSKTVREKNIHFIDGKSDTLMDMTQLIPEDSDLYGVYEDAQWNMAFQASLNDH